MEWVVRDRWVCVCSSAVLGGQKEWVRGREGGIREAGEEEVRSCEDASLSISLPLAALLLVLQARSRAPPGIQGTKERTTLKKAPTTLLRLSYVRVLPLKALSPPACQALLPPPPLPPPPPSAPPHPASTLHQPLTRSLAPKLLP